MLSCDNARARCTDVTSLATCKDDPDGAGCNNYLLRCECDCTAVDPTTEFEHGPFEDIFLTGIPNLWQFDYMCGDNNVSANAVGCGPVAAAMVMYWWAQQGYEGLVDEFLHGSGSPAEEPHDWQDLCVSCAQTTWTAASACRPCRRRRASRSRETSWETSLG